MHGRQLVTRLGMAASPGSRGPVTAARSAAGTTPTGSPARCSTPTDAPAAHPRTRRTWACSARRTSPGRTIRRSSTR